MSIVSFKNKEEAERVKDEVKNHLVDYLHDQGVKFLQDERNFHCFNTSGHKNQDKDPSSGLSDDKRAFECHGCGLKGDILTAAKVIEGREIDGQGYYSTLGYLAEKFNIKYETSNGRNNKPKKTETARYDFLSGDGEILFTSIRREWQEKGERKKEDIPYITDTTGELKSGFNGIPRVLYNLPELQKAIKDKNILFFVEGMKCADILKDIGLHSTTIWGGSNAWTKPHTLNYIPDLVGSNIVILPDNDEKGKKFSLKVANDLKNIANSIKYIDLNEDIAIPEGGDIEEWLQLGGTKEKLLKLVDQAREWKPGQIEEIEEDLPGWYEVNEKTKKVRVNTGLLASHLMQNIPAIYSTGRFYIYEDGVYEICNNGEERSIVMDHIIDKYRTMNLINDAALQWGVNKEININPDRLDIDPYILNLKNGLYNIKTKELKEHSSEILSTIQLNVKFNSDAMGLVFDKFINEAVPNKENLLLVQEMMGYSLTAFNNAKKAFIFNGKGDTGKTTVLNIIEDMVTSTHISNIPIQGLGDRFNTAELFGKLVNIYADLPSTPIRDGSMLKVLTGNDKVQAERKGQNPFTFRNQAKFIFSCNGLPPNYGDRSEAFYNRLIIIPFDNSVPKENQDPHLRDKLNKELDYIFQWALEGLERLISNDFIFTENQATLEAVAEYKINSNSALMFINECCELDPEEYISSSDIFEAYKIYCDDNRFSAMSSTTFSKEIERGNEGIIEKVRRIPGTNIRAFKGLKLVNNTDGKLKVLPPVKGRM